MFRKLVALAVACLLCAPGWAETTSFESSALLAAKDIELSKQKGDVVMTVFGQFVSFPLPKGFVQVAEGVENNVFILQLVPIGESAIVWSQTIKFIGGNGFASGNPNSTPMQFSDSLADEFKRACPDSYATLGFGPVKFGGHDGFAAVMSCGILNSVGKPYSHSALLITVKGERNYYTLEWIERGPGSKTPLELDRAKWEDRFKQLIPIKLYPIIPEEKSPYPVCVRAAK